MGHPDKASATALRRDSSGPIRRTESWPGPEGSGLCETGGMQHPCQFTHHVAKLVNDTLGSYREKATDASKSFSEFRTKVIAGGIIPENGASWEFAYYRKPVPAIASKVRSWADEPCCSRHWSKSRP